MWYIKYDESKDLTIIRMCGSVSDLCVRAGVPVWVIDDDSVGSSQIDSQTSDFSGQQEDKNGFVLQERQKNHLPKKENLDPFYNHFYYNISKFMNKL